MLGMSSPTLSSLLIEEGFRRLAISTDHALRAGLLPMLHQDPFDRMLVAQCLNRDLVLVTADARLRSRHDIGLLWAG